MNHKQLHLRKSNGLSTELCYRVHVCILIFDADCNLEENILEASINNNRICMV